MNKEPFDEAADWVALVIVGLLALILLSGFHCEFKFEAPT